MSFDATQPHDLPKLPPELILNDSIQRQLLKARTELAELKGFSLALPDPMLLLSPSILKEAIASSEIENINTTIEGVLQQSLFPESQQNFENKEVLRYNEAIKHGEEMMRDFSISSRLIKSVHKVLLGERSHGYRQLQNHLEDSNKNIIYTPPPSQKIEDLISNWENYIHDISDETDPLIKCIISHYQFEAIHPFNDGNGRTGRILMVLYLENKGVILYPILFISGYINKNRNEYYRLLQNVTEKNEWIPFIEYMLIGFAKQATNTLKQLLDVMDLYYTTKMEMKEKKLNAYNPELVDLLFSYPILTPVRLGTLLNVHYTTATRYLKELKENDFVEHKKIGKYQFYINKKLLDVLEQG